MPRRFYLTRPRQEMIKMPSQTAEQVFEILVVEDNPRDVELRREALLTARISNRLHVVHDELEALEFLRHKGKYDSAPRPDLILLALNVPEKDGHEVLEAIKADENLRTIPVFI